MPAWRLDEQDRQVRHFDVGAIDGNVLGFVAHVVLCRAEQPQVVNVNSRILATVHMGPPLGEKPQPIDVIGTALLDSDGIEPSERRQIKVFVDDRLRERKSQESRLARLNWLEPYYAEYVIHPSYIEPDDEVSLWRFSCAGFVLKAYEEAKIYLIDERNLPDVTLDTLKNAYPRMASLFDRDEVRVRLGIGEGTAWPIVLAGYVVNSLNRPPDAIRTKAFPPAQGDEYFPSVRLGPST
jgi:hypothetical protein